LLWVESPVESRQLKSLASAERVQIMLRGLTMLDIYSHFDPRSHGDLFGVTTFREWLPLLRSLQTLILGERLASVDALIVLLLSNPTLCPKLAMIHSFGYPWRWSALRDCIEKRNHLAMQDPSVHPIHTLRFPLALHRNISDRLKESLSGEFAGPFVAVPLQPYALPELLQPNNQVEEFPKECCYGCIRSGNAFECLKAEMKGKNFIMTDCASHWNRGPDRGVTITGYNMQLSGYLEGA
jgi:hypothetical protein